MAHEPKHWCYDCEHFGIVGWKDDYDEDALLGCRIAETDYDPQDHGWVRIKGLGRPVSYYDAPLPWGWCPLEDIDV